MVAPHGRHAVFTSKKHQQTIDSPKEKNQQKGGRHKNQRTMPASSRGQRLGGTIVVFMKAEAKVTLKKKNHKKNYGLGGAHTG